MNLIKIDNTVLREFVFFVFYTHRRGRIIEHQMAFDSQFDTNSDSWW